MARVEPSDVRQSLGATIGAASGTFGRGAQAVGRATQAVASSFDRAGDGLLGAASQFQQRKNERLTQEAELAYRKVKSDVLYGEKGLLQRQGRTAAGITEEGARMLQDHVSASLPHLENRVVRDAFTQMAQRDLQNTVDLLSRAEANKMEGVRRSDAAALHQEELQNLVMIDQGRFVGPLLGRGDEGMEDLAELIGRTEERLSISNPEIGDEAIRILARQELSSSASKAVFALMDAGPHNRPMAEAITEFWGGDWDVTTQVAVQKRITDEVGYGIMDRVVASAAGDLGPDAAPVDWSDLSADRFRKVYAAETGGPPPDSMVEEVKNRALRRHRLIDDKLARQQGERRSRTIVDLVQAMQDPGRSPESVEAQLKTAIKSANTADDLPLLNDLISIQSNIERNKSIFPEQYTARGLELRLQDASKLSHDEVMAAAGHMPESAWESWAKKFTDPQEGAKPIGSSQSELLGAINQVQSERGSARVLRSTASSAVARLDLLSDLEQVFVQRETRRPNRSELKDLARAIEFDLDDSGLDDGVSGTVGDFIARPGDASLSLDDANDVAFIGNILSVLESDPEIAVLASEAIGLSVDPRKIGPEELAANPALAAKLAEFAITSNVKFRFGSDRRALTGRQRLAEGSQRQKGVIP